jgi:aryl-alcohol dehydrogenase-like predicted oxidoreductase
MRTIELVEGIKSSVLGFGCAPILGSVDENTGKRALDIAFAHGVTHFDLARSYGYGEAERLVGKVMASRRDQIVLTSKFGIKANLMAALFRPVKPLVRIMKKAGPVPVPAGAAAAGLFHSRTRIDTRQMGRSLEVSLRALDTDYLDYFLIHEPLHRLENVDELSEMANRLKERGIIRAWGLAFMKHQTALHEDYLDRFDILQFNNSPVEPDYESIKELRSQDANILFSAIQPSAGTMTPKEKLKKLFSDFPRSVILCSMFNEKHLRENIENAC